MNRVYKLTPVSMYDVRRLEQWLEKMAAKGLFLKTYRSLVCTFTKGEPKRVRYRLEPHQPFLPEEFPNDMMELFQACGWKYTGDVNREIFIFSSSDPHAPEPHTDLDIQLEQWNKLYREARTAFFSDVAFTLIALIAITAILCWGGTPLTKLVRFSALSFDVLLFLILRPLFDLAITYTKFRELSAAIRELEGIPKKHRLWFPSRLFFSWTRILYLVLILALFCTSIGRALSQPQPVTEFSPLYVTDPESQVTVGTELARHGFSPFCPHQRQMYDFVTTPEGFIFLEVSWFDLPDWLSFLAVPTAKDLMTDSKKLNGQFPWLNKEAAVWTTREHAELGASWLSTADSEDGRYHTAAAALGDKVVLVQYVGGGDLEPYLGEIVDMIR